MPCLHKAHAWSMQQDLAPPKYASANASVHESPALHGGERWSCTSFTFRSRPTSCSSCLWLSGDLLEMSTPLHALNVVLKKYRSQEDFYIGGNQCWIPSVNINYIILYNIFSSQCQTFPAAISWPHAMHHFK